jgi:phage shock protein PspC (stress-responsive transcriptional regulator)
VCAGLAAYFDADVTLVRLAWVILSIVPGLLLGGVLVYAVCWILLPVATPDERRAYRGPRLTRSVTDRQVAGVCGGLAEYLGLDPTIVRILSVVLAIYPGALHRRGDRLSDRMDGHPRESGAVVCWNHSAKRRVRSVRACKDWALAADAHARTERGRDFANLRLS